MTHAKILWFLFFFVLAGFLPEVQAACTGSSPTWTSTIDRASVQTCVTNASNGDTINVGAGTDTWDGNLVVPTGKGVKLIGAGAENSVITLLASVMTNCRAGTPSRISGFTFTGKTSGNAIVLQGTCSGVRVDHNTFSDFANSVNAIKFDWYGTALGPIYGVVDHNTFTAAYNFRGVLVYGLWTWPTVSPLGSKNNVFIEDNDFDFDDITGGTAGSGCIDSNYGAYLVFRHNTVRNCLVTVHGEYNDSGGNVAAETYNNDFTADGLSWYWPDGHRLIHHQGAGEFIVFNNLFTAQSGKSSSAISLTNYRSYTGHGTRCDGNSSEDGNRLPQTTYYGYPCYHQLGRRGDATLSPVYSFANSWKDTGAVVDAAVEDIGGDGPPTAFTHLVANRDYYNYVAGFDGSTGVGVGLLKNRPVHCTTNPLERGGGVGYWATDEQTLYRCKAKDTWIKQYKPYVYPHPMVTQSLTCAERHPGGGPLGMRQQTAKKGPIVCK